MNLRRFPPLLIVGLSILNSACQKDEDDPPAPTPTSVAVALKVEHHMDGVPLIFDTILYTTAAEHAYSVSRLEYYLSEIILFGAGSTPNDTLRGPYYVNGSGTTSFTVGELPAAEYSGAALLLGLPQELNVTGGLPNTMENVNMAWPDPMGGGYHFIKFEDISLTERQLPGSLCTWATTRTCHMRHSASHSRSMAGQARSRSAST
ncbi:MAG: hypothetical protein IPH53_17500 [Flavobacteriales bacterium]|nr:hypothetical protein [Flavobacteriales bacterium]